MDQERHALLANVASLYFEEGLSQAAIAAQTGYSPSMISRLLTEARKLGVVEIRIHYPYGRRVDLERQLQALLGVKSVRVVVVEGDDPRRVTRQLGNVAAQLLGEHVRNGMTIGVAWGASAYETINALRPGPISGVHVIQMMGSLAASDPYQDGQELARHLARNYAGHFTTLPAPLFVDSEATRRSLARDLQILRAMEQFQHIELALMGIGSLDPERASLVRAGYLSVAQVEQLRQLGAVGDVCRDPHRRARRCARRPVNQAHRGHRCTHACRDPLEDRGCR